MDPAAPAPADTLKDIFCAMKQILTNIIAAEKIQCEKPPAKPKT